MKLDKYQFCTAVNNYKSMLDEENEMVDALGIGEWKPLAWIDTYYDFLTEVSEVEEDPAVGTILDWFVFETDFGKRKDMCKVTDNYTGRTWMIETPEILYDFITRDE